ncbi:flagellar motor switch protein FliN [Aurantiacibacter atlanticus]|uniref:Flagellar motor switch protein FliN n=1 Tax=Aurantiacibacter atlanticus TaxID=1648404 RepID=A0A0H4VA00_9SPHN|nr:flagellar motor switch protein FliN [Aurantiacibacter atlanticus]AKQ41452.1 flagellar motor switch protein FliN [Aurantiacibacter atlanticus]MDF1835902.1 flagellar motor switch protein FliN [Alteraurantiacibacter sp. bin_em_oilr2.035]
MTDNLRGLDLIRDVDVSLTVELGRTRLALRDVLELVEDSIVPLDRQIDELLDIYVNGKPIAKGEVITEGGRFALRIVEMISERRSGEDRRAEERSAPLAENA